MADQGLGAFGATGSRTASLSVTGSLVGVMVALQPSQTTYYNPNADIATETDTGLSSPASQSYSYDSLNRVSAQAAGSYSYDTSGDPTQLTQIAQSFSPSHEVTSAVSTITRVGTSSAGDGGTGSTLSVSLPAGVQPNDQILLAVTLPGNQSIKSTPSGYTLVGTFSSGSGSSNAQEALYRRTAQAGDTSVTVTFSKTFAKAATVVVYRGVNPTSPIPAR